MTVESAGHRGRRSLFFVPAGPGFCGSVRVMPTRFTIMGYGEEQPIATNDTTTGREQNRRVEVAIYANDKLKKVAEEKTSG